MNARQKALEALVEALHKSELLTADDAGYFLAEAIENYLHDIGNLP